MLTLISLAQTKDSCRQISVEKTIEVVQVNVVLTGSI